MKTSTKPKRWSRAALVTSAVLATTLVACGSDDDSSDTTATTAPAATSVDSSAATSSPDATPVESSATSPQATDPTATTAAVPASGEPIKLGVIVSLSGTGFVYPETVSGTEVAVAAVNAAGGVNGRPLEIEVCDDMNDPNQAAACAREMAESDVVATVGTISRYGDALLPVLLDAGIPDIGASLSDVSSATLENSFPVDAGIAGLMLGGVSYFAELGGKSVVYASSPSGSAAAIGDVLDGAYGDLGLENLGHVIFPSGAVDLAAQAAQVKDLDPDIIVGITAGQQLGQFITALEQQGVDLSETKLLLPAGFLGPNYVKEVGSAAEGVYVAGATVPVTTTDDPGIQQFLAEVAEYGEPDLEQNESMLKSWATIHILAEQLKALPSIDRESIMSALPTVGPIDFPPVAPFDWGQPVEGLGGTRRFSDEAVVSQVQDGKIVLVAGPFDIFAPEG